MVKSHRGFVFYKRKKSSNAVKKNKFERHLTSLSFKRASTLGLREKFRGSLINERSFVRKPCKNAKNQA